MLLQVELPALDRPCNEDFSILRGCIENPKFYTPESSIDLAANGQPCAMPSSDVTLAEKAVSAGLLLP